MPVVLFNFFLAAPVNANEAPPATPPGADQECSRELLISYFPKAFVTETLKKYNVPEDKWNAITEDLAQKDKQVIKTVEEKASKMDPNPLKDPQQRQAAVKLFRETLTDLFSSTLKANGVTDEKQILDMLNDIQQQKAKRFAMCMQKMTQSKASSSGLTASNDSSKDKKDSEDEEDDLDDEDEDDADDHEDQKDQDNKK